MLRFGIRVETTSILFNLDLLICSIIFFEKNSIRYENCWKAIMAYADGVILVYNPDAPSQNQQLGDWFDFFVKKNGLRDEQCLIFAHRSGSGNDRFKPRKRHRSPLILNYCHD